MSLGNILGSLYLEGKLTLDDISLILAVYIQDLAIDIIEYITEKEDKENGINN